MANENLDQWKKSGDVTGCLFNWDSSRCFNDGEGGRKLAVALINIAK